MTHLLLIHGAWQGAWAWDRLVPRLENLNHVCHAVDLPGNGNGDDRTAPEDVSLDLYMNYLAVELDRIGQPVVVVGHSSGGIMASQLAENAPDRVQAIIYVAGMMLPSRTGFADLVEDLMPTAPEVAGIIPHLEWSADGETSTVADGAARKIFYQDCPKKLSDAAAAKLKPHPQRGRAITARLTKRRFGRVPRAYIEATLDRAVVPAAQRRMQELVPGAARYVMKAGHAPLLGKPGALAATIDQAIQQFPSRRASPAKAVKRTER